MATPEFKLIKPVVGILDNCGLVGLDNFGDRLAVHAEFEGDALKLISSTL